MQKPKRLGKGLEDISHYFISHNKRGEEPSTLRADSLIQYSAISIVDIFDPYRGAILATKLSVELCKNGIKVLLIDADIRFPGIAFMLGISIPGYSFRHYFQDQYQPSDIIYTGPYGIRLLAPHLKINDTYSMKVSDLSLMFEILVSAEKEIDIIIIRQFENILQPIIDEAIFVVPAQSTGMVRTYRVIKTFARGGDGKKVGIIITGAEDEPAAARAYEKISNCTENSSGIRPFFCGNLSDVNKEALSLKPSCLSNIMAHISEISLHNREKGREKRLFFERLQYLMGGDRLTAEEGNSLLV